MADMNEIRELCFDFCMKEEGGSLYTNDPHDPGGPTKYGIALNYNRSVIPDKNEDGVVNAADVKLLDEADARKIFKNSYFDKYKCNAFPGPIAFMMGDMVFNPGPGAAAKIIQQSLNAFSAKLAVDGAIGPLTLAEAGVQYKKDCVGLLREMTARRAQYYAVRPNFGRYGLGWLRRTERCLIAALRIYWGLE